MASNSALAGDEPGGWGDKKHAGGWNERRSRWREDERDVAGAGSRAGGGHGWTADRRDRARGASHGASFPAPLPPHPGSTGGGSALLGNGNGSAAAGRDLGGGWYGGAAPGGAPGAVPTGAPPVGMAPAGFARGAGARMEPARPDGGRGFSVGRGRGGGFGGAKNTFTSAGRGAYGGPQGGAGAPLAFGGGAPRLGEQPVRVGLGGIVLGGDQGQGGAPLRTALSGGVPAPAEPIRRHGPVRFKYTHAELRSLRAALGAGAALPATVDPDSVPVTTVKPGDAMWELTVEGARGGAAARAGGPGREWANGDGSRGGISAIPAPKLPVGFGSGLVGSERAFGGGARGDPALTAAEAARFNPAQSSWLTEGAGAGGALESETENTNCGGGVVGDPDVDDNDVSSADASSRASARVSNDHAPEDSSWIYKDPSGTHQGPFPRADLLEWHSSGYFPLDLPLRPADAPPEAPFALLAEMLACGWRYPGPGAAARAEREKAEREEAAREETARHEEERLRRAAEERAEQERRAREQQSAHQTRMQNRDVAPTGGGTGWIGGGPPRSLADLEGTAYNSGASSPPGPGPGAHANLLANLFSGGGSHAGGAPPPPLPGGGVSLADLERSMAAGDGPPRAPQPGSFDAAPAWGGAPGGDTGSGWDVAPAPGAQAVPAPPPVQPASPPSRSAWGGGGGAPAQKSLAEIQREEEERAAARRREVEARAEANPGVFGGGGLATAWGGGAAAAGPSLAQIQADELRRSAARAAAAQQQASQQQHAFGGAGGGPGPAGAWAGGASAAMRAAPAGPPRDMRAAPQQQQQQSGVGGFWDSLPSGGQAESPPRPGPGAGPGWGAPAAAAPAAAAPPGDFKSFCRAEMRALNDSDDLTLVDFLLSLPSAGEVTEYVQLYLGNSPRAAAFGNELIRVKRANPGMASVEDAPSEGLGNGSDAGEFKKAKRRGKK